MGRARHARAPRGSRRRVCQPRGAGPPVPPRGEAPEDWRSGWPPACRRRQRGPGPGASRRDPTAELLARYERATPKALRWRRRLRWIPGSQPDDGGRFTMRELFEVILTRDTWMHRVDIARATGRDMVLTPEHDGRIVEDCVLDWAKHGRAFN